MDDLSGLLPFDAPFSVKLVEHRTVEPRQVLSPVAWPHRSFLGQVGHQLFVVGDFALVEVFEVQVFYQTAFWVLLLDQPVLLGLSLLSLSLRRVAAAQAVRGVRLPLVVS